MTLVHTGSRQPYGVRANSRGIGSGDRTAKVLDGKADLGRRGYSSLPGETLAAILAAVRSGGNVAELAASLSDEELGILPEEPNS